MIHKHLQNMGSLCFSGPDILHAYPEILHDDADCALPSPGQESHPRRLCFIERGSHNGNGSYISRLRG